VRVRDSATVLLAMTKAIVLSVLCIFPVVARAEMPPSAYENMRKRAPVLVKIVVVGVDTDEKKVSSPEFRGVETHTNVDAIAKVISVVRSNSDLQPGAVIHIKYVSSERPVPGPRPIPILKKNEEVFAYLEGGPAVFEPAADGASFSKRIQDK
jgi:hypothetical protein